MAHPGQAAQDFRTGQTSLRIHHVGNRTSMGTELTDDAYTQDNPAVVTTAATVSDQLPANPKDGVLGGSVALTRPDVANGLIGGPQPDETDPANGDVRPLGLFVKDAADYDFENQPAQASGMGTYVSGQGTYGNALYETQNLSTEADLTYHPGDELFCSRNGYLTKVEDANNALELALGYSAATLMGVVKIAPDSELDELVFDLRI